MTTIYSIDYIVSDPDHRRGRPRIRGTGITVHNIAEDVGSGMTVEQIVEAFDLTSAQVYAALSYYYDHKEAIDREILEDQRQTEHYIARYGKGITLDELKRRLEARKTSE